MDAKSAATEKESNIVVPSPSLCRVGRVGSQLWAIMIWQATVAVVQEFTRRRRHLRIASHLFGKNMM
jgi:hypothetical protein